MCLESFKINKNWEISFVLLTLKIIQLNTFEVLLFQNFHIIKQNKSIFFHKYGWFWWYKLEDVHV